MGFLATIKERFDMRPIGERVEELNDQLADLMVARGALVLREEETGAPMDKELAANQKQIAAIQQRLSDLALAQAEAERVRQAMALDAEAQAKRDRELAIHRQLEQVRKVCRLVDKDMPALSRHVEQLMFHCDELKIMARDSGNRPLRDLAMEPVWMLSRCVGSHMPKNCDLGVRADVDGKDRKLTPLLDRANKLMEEV